jgi:D-2-hydroxyacid dehydrogenase (NADP+)
MTSEEIHVVLTTPLDEHLLKKITSISKTIRLHQASPLVLAERKGEPEARENLDAVLGQAEVLYGWIHHFPKSLLGRTPRLKWIQVMSAGVDRLPEEILKSRIRIVSASGLHGTPMGEVVLEMMLMFAKDAPACFRMKQTAEWKRYRPNLLKGQTVGILGLGIIGREIARLCQAFGMRVIGMRRSDRPDHPIQDVDRIYPREKLQDLLAASDFVVLALPLTEETIGMISEKELRCMKRDAYLINVARGAIVDEVALIRALEEKTIAGAGLDVFIKEPLSAESPFYGLPNVIFSPHISGEMPDYEGRATEVFCENLKRYLAGTPFLHEVDKEKGY